MSQQAITTELNPYEKLYDTKLSLDVIQEMQGNLTGFFVELIEADREIRLMEKLSNEGLMNDQNIRNSNCAD